jgi:hypothetical protein
LNIDQFEAAQISELSLENGIYASLIQSRTIYSFNSAIISGSLCLIVLCRGCGERQALIPDDALGTSISAYNIKVTILQHFYR